jgi:hypothetical protein
MSSKAVRVRSSALLFRIDKWHTLRKEQVLNRVRELFDPRQRAV